MVDPDRNAGVDDISGIRGPGELERTGEDWPWNVRGSLAFIRQGQFLEIVHPSSIVQLASREEMRPWRMESRSCTKVGNSDTGRLVSLAYVVSACFSNSSGMDLPDVCTSIRHNVSLRCTSIHIE